MKTPISLLTLTLLTWNANASSVQPSVPAPLMKSAQVDLVNDTVTLPLHIGKLQDGSAVFFILTDVSDRMKAADLGLVTAPALKKTIAAKSTRTATIDQAGIFTFDKGTVDFKPMAQLVPGDAPNYFPPKSFTPGSVGSADYSPFVNVNGIVYNAPIIASAPSVEALTFCDGNPDYSLVHDKVVKLCPQTGEVTLKLTHGFASGEEVVYISTDSNNPMPATMENATFTPATVDLVGRGADETLYAFANGETGIGNPERQGFTSALGGEGSPLNVLEGLSLSSRGYSPLWDIQVAVWTDAAIKADARKRITNGDEIGAASQAGNLVSPMGGKVSTLGLLVNCPVVGFVK